MTGGRRRPPQASAGAALGQRGGPDRCDRLRRASLRWSRRAADPAAAGGGGYRNADAAGTQFQG